MHAKKKRSGGHMSKDRLACFMVLFSSLHFSLFSKISTMNIFFYNQEKGEKHSLVTLWTCSFCLQAWSETILNFEPVS